MYDPSQNYILFLKLYLQSWSNFLKFVIEKIETLPPVEYNYLALIDFLINRVKSITDISMYVI